jgi:hypothetical protein
MKLLKPKCPACLRRGLDHVATGTCEMLLGTATIEVAEDGTFDYAGETDVHWDTQECIRDASGGIQLSCGYCGTEWFSPVEPEKGEAISSPKETAQLIILTQPVYACVMGKAIRVVAIVTGSNVAERAATANKACTDNENLSVLHDDQALTYLASKDDLGVPVTKMEAFRT